LNIEDAELESCSAGQEENIFPMIDTQIRLISSMEPEICSNILRNLSEKLAGKFPATTLSYSKISQKFLNLKQVQ